MKLVVFLHEFVVISNVLRSLNGLIRCANVLPEYLNLHKRFGENVKDLGNVLQVILTFGKVVVDNVSVGAPIQFLAFQRTGSVVMEDHVIENIAVLHDLETGLRGIDALQLMHDTLKQFLETHHGNRSIFPATVGKVFGDEVPVFLP